MLDGVSLISTNDPHASEFVGAQDRRLSFFSGFSGDTGTAVIGQDAAWLFVDGRFWTQARSEVDSQVRGLLNNIRISMQLTG